MTTGARPADVHSVYGAAHCIGDLNSFFSDGIYIAEPASSQSHECVVKIAILLRMVRGDISGRKRLPLGRFLILAAQLSSE